VAVIGDSDAPQRSTTLPLVSILTGTYNRSNVLRLVIETVRRQTVPDWEWVIVGDQRTGRLLTQRV
jgi:glycosyltransferase involved in cell wall biosynthesis